jgi:DNA-binding NarL/FixJ family response regulator
MPVKSTPFGSNYFRGREVEVLRLIAAGHSNRTIAQVLFISLNTVLHHVSSTLIRLGVANRSEAAAYAVCRGPGRIAASCHRGQGRPRPRSQV